MDYYSKLKSGVDIYQIASELGFNGSSSGRSYQGGCPRHGSKKGKCFSISPSNQSFKCFHCGEGGDVINLVELYKNCDHVTAVNYLADKVGMPHIASRNITPEEQEKKHEEYEDKILVEDILTKATYWYHEQLKKHSDIFDHLRNHYGFSEEIINDQMIGFAPVVNSEDSASELAQHLNTIPEFKGKIHKSGLFNFSRPGGHYYDFFKGRIIFPYWKNGKVVYMAARKTDLTPDDGYEDATYKKLRRHDANDEKNKYISKFIQNNTFIGEDTIRGEKEIIITEGIPDAISAIDHGFPVISPATTTFREDDNKKLEMMTMSADAIYIINDNEDNNAGKEGALKTGRYLLENGRNVFLVELPRPEGIEKIDLNEYLRDNSKEDLRKLMDSTPPLLDMMIKELPNDSLKAIPIIGKEFGNILTELKGGVYEYYMEMLTKRLKIKRKVIEAEIEQVKKEKKSTLKVKIDPVIEKLAQNISMNPFLFTKRIDVINEAGVVGERVAISMYFAALDSRLLPNTFSSTNVLAVKNAGHFGSGKSYSLAMCLEIYPKMAYHQITNGSAKSLYYLKDGLRNKSLVVTEGFQYQTNNAGDSELVYATRSLLSEGSVTYQVTQKDAEGNQVTIEKKIDGPTSFITTTVMDSLEPQLEDRLFTIHPDESMDQTKNVNMMTAEQAQGVFQELDTKTVASWRRFHEILKPVIIVIPYATDVAKHINNMKPLPIAARRSFKRVLSVIKTITCCYQYQRKRDSEGRLIAEISDYYMALQIVQESFKENMGQRSKKDDERIETVKKEGITQYKKLSTEWGVSGTAVTNWMKRMCKEGLIVWCNETGNEYSDDKELNRAKRSGKAYIKISDSCESSDTTGLPTPHQLTDDPEWNEGGKLLKQYDLILNSSQGDKVSRGVKVVTSPTIDTASDNQTIENIPKPSSEEGGDKVISLNSDNIKSKLSNETNDEIYQPDYELPIMDDVITNNKCGDDINSEEDEYIDEEEIENDKEDQKETGILLF